MKQNNEFGSMHSTIEEIRGSGISMNPTTPEELEKIQEIAGEKQIPKAYTEFYKHMGNGVAFLRGHSCFHNEIFNLRSWAEELLNENNFQTKLTENDFVFWMSQGYMFCFFKLDEGDDPPIYYYCEGKNLSGFYRIAESFSSFLYRMYIKDRDLFKIKE